MSSVFNLKTFAFGLRQRFVVRDFLDDASHALTESLVDFFEAGLGVLNRVVKEGCRQDVGVSYATYGGHRLCDTKPMIDVGRCFGTLPSLMYKDIWTGRIRI